MVVIVDEGDGGGRATLHSEVYVQQYIQGEYQAYALRNSTY
jgi:hypothetical protein